MDSLCSEQENGHGASRKRAGVQAISGRKWPKSMILLLDADAQEGQSRASVEDRETRGKAATINYDELVKSWQE